MKIDGDLNLISNEINSDLSFQMMKLAPYLKPFDLTDFDGTIDGNGNFSGNINDLQNITADISLNTLLITYKQKKLLKADKFKISKLEKHVKADTKIILLDEGIIDINGDIDLAANGKISLNSTIPLEIIKPFSDEFISYPAGNIKIEGEVVKLNEELKFNFSTILDGISFTDNSSGTKIENVNGQFTADNKSFQLEKLAGKIGEGNFLLTGKGGVKNYQADAYQFQLTTTALPINIPETMNLAFNSDISVKGKGGKAAVTGDIVLLEGSYYKDLEFNIFNSIRDKKREVSAAAPAEDKNGISSLDSISINLAVSQREPFLIDNNLANLYLTPDLKIRGSFSTPIIEGRAEISEGQILFQKKEFIIQKGVIDFINPYKTEISLDIESVATIRDWEILLQIEGEAEMMKFVLTSTPYLDQGDILSLILTGKTVEELTGGGEGEIDTEMMLYEFLSSAVADDVKRETGLDIFQLSSDDEEDRESITLTLGKKLTDRLTLFYAIESEDGETVQRTSTEYKILENIILNAFQDTRGDYGSEIKYKHEFR